MMITPYLIHVTYEPCRSSTIGCIVNINWTGMGSVLEGEYHVLHKP
jgi:hypothetical protein